MSAVVLRPEFRDVAVRLLPWGFGIVVGLLVTRGNPAGMGALVVVVATFAIRLVRARVEVDDGGVRQRKWRWRSWSWSDLARLMPGELQPELLTLHPVDAPVVRLVWWVLQGRPAHTLAAGSAAALERAEANGVLQDFLDPDPAGPRGRDEIGFACRLVDGGDRLEVRARHRLQVAFAIPVLLGLAILIPAALGGQNIAVVAFLLLWTAMAGRMWARTMVPLVGADLDGVSVRWPRARVAWADVEAIEVPVASALTGRSPSWIIVRRRSQGPLRIRLDPIMVFSPSGGSEADRWLLVNRLSQMAVRFGFEPVPVDG